MKLYVAPSRIAGRGCFTSKQFRKGDIIGEYTGEIVGDEVADTRYAEQEMTYLFYLKKGVYIDAGADDNPVKYINHSCKPNCESEQDDERIFIRAIQSIRKGDELTYDYQLLVDKEDEDEYPCMCNDKQCRGTMRTP